MPKSACRKSEELSLSTAGHRVRSTTAQFILLVDDETTMKRKLVVPLTLAAAVACLFFFQIEIASSQWSSFSFNASDPGVRGGAAGAGGQLAGLSGTQAAFFTAGAVDFAEQENVPNALGPRMNLDSRGGAAHHPAPPRPPPPVRSPAAAPGEDHGGHT